MVALRKTQHIFLGKEWESMARHALQNKTNLEHPILERLQTQVKNLSNVVNMGRYSRMHHRHNRG